MPATPKRLRFSEHVIGVVAAATMGPFLAVLLHGAWLVDAGVSPGELVALAPLMWLAMALIAGPVPAVVLSLLWPVTRSGSPAGRWACPAAGLATGILLAPLTSKGWDGASVKQMTACASLGIAVSAVYALTLARLHRSRRNAPGLRTIS